MSKKAHVKGKCLCGKIGIETKEFSVKVGACHCSICRKWGGGPLMSSDCGTAVLFSGEENIEVYPSSEWAERGFCKSCGTHLFYRLLDTGQYIMPVGFFENLPDVTFDHQVFIDEKPAYYNFADKTNTMTGQEIFDQYYSQSKE